MALVGLKMIKMKRYIALLPLLFAFACGNEKPKQNDKPSVKDVVVAPPRVVEVPEFNADSAYNFIKKQVEFGPRIPGSAAHAKTAEWLIKKFKEYADEVSVQETTLTTWDNKSFKIKNIQASFQPDKPRRVLLSAHWDTRPYSDMDLAEPKKSFDGADDGGSGVGVLLEIARAMKNGPQSDIGVDI